MTGINWTHLGDVLRARRDAEGLSLIDLAGKVGVDDSTISRIEHGRPAKLRNVTALLGFFDIELDTFLFPHAASTAKAIASVLDVEPTRLTRDRAFDRSKQRDASVFPLLLPEEVILRRVSQLGKQLEAELLGVKEEVVILANLLGAIEFCMDLVRSFAQINPAIHVCQLTHYHGLKLPIGEPSFDRSISEGLAGKVVILVEDIIDRGNTFKMLHEAVMKQEPARIINCVLLKKQKDREVTLPFIDHVLFTIPDVHVVGYGMDIGFKYRQLRDIYYDPEQSEVQLDDPCVERIAF